MTGKRIFSVTAPPPISEAFTRISRGIFVLHNHHGLLRKEKSGLRSQERHPSGPSQVYVMKIMALSSYTSAEDSCAWKLFPFS
jgi:hypothetical protein